MERGEGGLFPAFTCVDVGADVQEHVITHLAEGINIVVEVVVGGLILVYQNQQIIVTVGAGISSCTGAIEPQGSPLGQYALTKFRDACYDLFLFHFNLQRYNYFGKQQKLFFLHQKKPPAETGNGTKEERDDYTLSGIIEINLPPWGAGVLVSE